MIIIIIIIIIIGRALLRYRRGQGFESRTSLNFFSGLLFATATSSPGLFPFFKGKALRTRLFATAYKLGI